MKIRSNYVSNSSSSSYYVESTCYMGINHHTEGYDDIPHKLKSEIYKYSSYAVYDEGDELVIGFSVLDMKEDETKSEFRKRVYDKLKILGYSGKLEDVDWQLPEYPGKCD